MVIEWFGHGEEQFPCLELSPVKPLQFYVVEEGSIVVHVM